MGVTTRIRNGVIQTPRGPVEADVLIDGELISALLSRDSTIEADTEIEASGLWVLPGLIDLHAHTRVPGYEYKEDYLTSSRAAAMVASSSVMGSAMGRSNCMLGFAPR